MKLYSFAEVMARYPQALQDKIRRKAENMHKKCLKQQSKALMGVTSRNGKDERHN